jgi:hypothetical protein
MTLTTTTPSTLTTLSLPYRARIPLKPRWNSRVLETTCWHSSNMKNLMWLPLLQLAGLHGSIFALVSAADSVAIGICGRTRPYAHSPLVGLAKRGHHDINYLP